MINYGVRTTTKAGQKLALAILEVKNHLHLMSV